MPENQIEVGIALSGDTLTPALQQVREQISQVQQQVQQVAAVAPRGGKEAGEGSEMVKELMSGITYNIGLWNVGMMASQAVLDAVTGTVQQATEAFEGLSHIMASTGESAEVASSKWMQIGSAAFFTGKSFKETYDRALDLQTTGLNWEQAISRTQMVQQVMKNTGIDITDVTKKVQGYSASFEDLIKLSQAGPEFRPLQEPAIAGARKEALKPMAELEMQYRQKAASEEMADRHKIWQRDMEDSHIAAERQLEDFTRVTDREMEDRHHAIEREMELRHLAADRELEDIQRNAERQTTLAEQNHNRTISELSSISGAAEQSMGIFKKGQPVVPVDLSKLREEMKTGMDQIAKDTGISVEAQLSMMQQGMMSAGTALQAAQAGRQQKLQQEQWAREDQAREQQRKFQDEELRVQEQLYEEQRNLTRELADLAQQLSRGQSDEERKANRQMFDEELEQNRKAAQDRLDLEYGFVKDKLDLELKALALIEAKEMQANQEVADQKAKLIQGIAAGYASMAGVEGGVGQLPREGMYGGLEERGVTPAPSQAAQDLQKSIEGLQQTYQDQKAGVDRIHEQNQKTFQADTDNTTATKANTEALRELRSLKGPGGTLPPGRQGAEITARPEVIGTVGAGYGKYYPAAATWSGQYGYEAWKAQSGVQSLGEVPRPGGMVPLPGSRMFGPSYDVGTGLPPLSPQERAQPFFPFGKPLETGPSGVSGNLSEVAKGTAEGNKILSSIHDVLQKAVTASGGT